MVGSDELDHVEKVASREFLVGHSGCQGIEVVGYVGGWRKVTTVRIGVDTHSSMLSSTTDSRLLANSRGPLGQSAGLGRQSAIRREALSGSIDPSSSGLIGLTASSATPGGTCVRVSLLGLPYRGERLSRAVAQAPATPAGSSGTHRSARSHSLGTSSAASARSASSSGAGPKASAPSVRVHRRVTVLGGSVEQWNVVTGW